MRLLGTKQGKPLQNVFNTVSNKVGGFIENPLPFGFIKMNSHLFSQTSKRQVQLIFIILLLVVGPVNIIYHGIC